MLTRRRLLAALAAVAAAPASLASSLAPVRRIGKHPALAMPYGRALQENVVQLARPSITGTLADMRANPAAWKWQPVDSRRAWVVPA